MISKEQFHSWCVSNLRLTRADKRFFDYIWQQVLNHEAITTAQNDLWLRIIRKHYRQLQRVYSAAEVKQLEATPWSIKLIETIQQHSITLETGTDGGKYVLIKTPYNADMNRVMSRSITANLRFAHGKGWYCPFNLRSLGQAYRRLASARLWLCQESQELVDRFSHRKKRNWVPTVFAVGGRWYISCITDSVAKYLPDCPTLTFETAAKLAALGLDFSPIIRRRIRQQYGRLVSSLLFNSYTVVNLRTLAVARDVKIFCEESKMKRVLAIDDSNSSMLFAGLIARLRHEPYFTVLDRATVYNKLATGAAILDEVDLIIAENSVPEYEQYTSAQKFLYTANIPRNIMTSRYHPRIKNR
jgi:hypothetical protein